MSNSSPVRVWTCDGPVMIHHEDGHPTFVNLGLLTIRAAVRGISRIPRFNGQPDGFFTVTEHCCHLHDLLAEDNVANLLGPYARLHNIYEGQLTNDVLRYSLLHDTPEGICGMGDIQTKIKRVFAPALREVETLAMQEVWSRFVEPDRDSGRLQDAHAIVDPWDKDLGDWEAAYFGACPLNPDNRFRNMRAEHKPRYWSPEEAEREWLSRWNALSSSTSKPEVGST